MLVFCPDCFCSKKASYNREKAVCAWIVRSLKNPTARYKVLHCADLASKLPLSVALYRLGVTSRSYSWSRYSIEQSVNALIQQSCLWIVSLASQSSTVCVAVPQFCRAIATYHFQLLINLVLTLRTSISHWKFLVLQKALAYGGTDFYSTYCTFSKSWTSCCKHQGWKYMSEHIMYSHPCITAKGLMMIKSLAIQYKQKHNKK